MSKVPLAATVAAAAAAVAVAGCGESKRPTPKLPPPMNEQQLIKTAAPAVVAVKARAKYGDVTTGTGFRISRDEILTAAHVVSGARNIKVRFSDGTVVPARTQGLSICGDQALLKLTEDVPGPVLPLGPGGSLPPNSSAELLHYGANIQGFGRGSQSTGRLTLANDDVVRPELGAALPPVDHLLQFGQDVPAGASGAATLDVFGRVLGMVVLGDGDQSYAIRVDELRRQLPLLRKGDMHDSLGVSLTPFDLFDFRAFYGRGRLARLVEVYLRHSNMRGLFVEASEDGGPAWRAKVFRGDMITAINGVPVRSLRGVCGETTTAAPGDRLTISGVTLVPGPYFLHEWKVTARVQG